MDGRDSSITIVDHQTRKFGLRAGEDAAMRLAFRVYYSPSANTHYIDLAKLEVEIVNDEAEIELAGERVRCVIEGVGLAPDQISRATPSLYLQRKEERRHTGNRSGDRKPSE
jgi:hypothetical protein